MTQHTHRTWIVLPLFALAQAALCLPVARAESPPAAKPLIDFAAAGAEQRLVPTSDQVTVMRSADGAVPGAVVTIQPGKEGYPGVCVKPEGAATWDLSAFGHVEAHVVNTGTRTLMFALRVDNAGDWHENPWNTEQTYLKPGQTGTVTVVFGYAYGLKPSFPLNSKAVANLLLFTAKSAAVQSFRIESVVAGGPAGEKPPTPPLNPKTVRLEVKDGVLLGAGAACEVAVGGNTVPWKIARPGEPLPAIAVQVEAKGGVEGAVDGGGATLTFPASKGQPVAVLKPSLGRWDLRRATEVRVRVKNVGQTAVTPTVQMISDGGPTDAIAGAQPLAPGAEAEIVIPFDPVITPKGAPNGRKGGFWGGWENLPGTGTKFVSDAVAALKITAKHDGDARLLVMSITAAAPPATLPDWLGQRPPVEGDWVKTFDDEFDGPTIDEQKWNFYGPNFWDQATHWSKDNLILKDGKAILHFEKKTGYQNDDPKGKQTKYACGFLETYGKWVQRYGYYEARLKLPQASGLWPTFWMMPDRGIAAGPQWKRQDTGNDGMELDIMEHLTRWGPHRYNVACHWDGYGKGHQSIGSGCNYVQADKDGFITPGMLWTPGLIVYYCNGKELWRWEHPRVSVVPSNLIIEITTGGWDNNSVDDSQLPADYVFDYVRVWQRKDLASAVDGYKSPPKPEAQPAEKPVAK